MTFQEIEIKTTPLNACFHISSLIRATKKYFIWLVVQLLSLFIYQNQWTIIINKITMIMSIRNKNKHKKSKVQLTLQNLFMSLKNTEYMKNNKNRNIYSKISRYLYTRSSQMITLINLKSLFLLLLINFSGIKVFYSLLKMMLRNK